MASNQGRAETVNSRPCRAIAAGYAVVWAVAAISPHNRFDWLLENLLVFVCVGCLVVGHRRRPLSDRSYFLIAIFLSLHAVGAHYTYSLTPPGAWLQDALALDRNPYDRFVHFCFGLLLVLPMREIVLRRVRARGCWRAALPLGVIVAFSAVYEMLEWGAAMLISPDAAMAFLGTQGDVFDAQKDGALATAGAALGLVAAGWHDADRKRTGG